MVEITGRLVGDDGTSLPVVVHGFGDPRYPWIYMIPTGDEQADEARCFERSRQIKAALEIMIYAAFLH